jgi:hypothetical protein
LPFNGKRLANPAGSFPEEPEQSSVPFACGNASHSPPGDIGLSNHSAKFLLRVGDWKPTSRPEWRQNHVLLDQTFAEGQPSQGEQLSTILSDCCPADDLATVGRL